MPTRGALGAGSVSYRGKRGSEGGRGSNSGGVGPHRRARSHVMGLTPARVQAGVGELDPRPPLW